MTGKVGNNHKVQSFYNAMFGVQGMDSVRSEPFSKGAILQRSSMVIKLGSHNTTMLYPNPCYNEVCNKRTALYYTVDSEIFPRILFSQKALKDILVM